MGPATSGVEIFATAERNAKRRMPRLSPLRYVTEFRRRKKFEEVSDDVVSYSVSRYMNLLGFALSEE